MASGNCPTIEIYPEQITLFADDGRVFLDVDDNTAFALAKELANLSGLVTVESEKEITVTLPQSAKNNFYLKHLYDPQVAKTQNYLTCRVTTGSTTHYYCKLFPIQDSHIENQVILKYENDWIEKLKGTKVKDIDLPTFDYTKEEINARWAEDGIYNDGDVGFWFPVVYYGGWRVRNRRLVVEDLRPHLHALFLLQQMFKAIGWCFKSPFYETTFGRRLICYILKDDYSNNDELNKRRQLYARKVYPANGGIAISGRVINWDYENDADNNFDTVSGRYEKPFEGTIRINVIFGNEITLPDGVNFGNASFFIYQLHDGSPQQGSYEDIVHREEINLEPNTSHEFEVSVNILADEYLYFSFSGSVNGEPVGVLPITTEVHLFAKSQRTFYVKGDVIDLKKEVDQEMTCYELFTGFQHLIFGIADEDYSNKTVTLYTPHDADIFGETIEGFYIDDAINLRDEQPAYTTKSVINQNNIKRYVNLGFKKSTDAYLKDKKRLTDGLPFFSKIIDTGESTNEETEDDLNPTFEGTTLIQETLFGWDFQNDRPAAYTRWFPVMADNKDNKISYNIKPRIMYAYGYAQQTSSLIAFNFELAYQVQLAMAWQERGNINIGNIIFPDEKLVYGDDEFDLWKMAYAKFYLQYKQRLVLDVLAYFNHNQYELTLLKNKYIVEHKGHSITGRMLRINDWQPCNALSAQVIILPDISATAVCLTEPTPNQCANSASITHTSDCDCHYFSLLGTFECNVTDIYWEYKNDDTSNEWTEIPDSDNTAQLCDLILQTYVRARVSFDCPECPDLYVPIFVNPCVFDLRCNIIQYTNAIGEICLQWGFTGNTTCGYTVEVTINGDPLDDPYLFCGAEYNTEYEFIATFSFENGCEDQTLTCTIITNENACLNFPTLQCVPVGNGCYEFIITGNLSSPVETFIVTYDCNGQIGTWMPGDPPVCCSTDFTAHALVFFCDCPEICTQTVTCVGSGCTMYNPGTAIMLAVCN